MVLLIRSSIVKKEITTIIGIIMAYSICVWHIQYVFGVTDSEEERYVGAVTIIFCLAT